MHTTTLPNEILPDINKKKIRQIQEESDSWKRMLGCLQAENNYLKIRLAQLVNEEISQKFLAQAETLQNVLIQKDELIALNRTALADFDKYLIRCSENSKGIKDILKKRERIRQLIEQLETKFSRHMIEFNDSLSQNL